MPAQTTVPLEDVFSAFCAAFCAIAVAPTPAATASTTANASILALFMLSAPTAPSTKVNIFSLSATAISDYIACETSTHTHHSPRKEHPHETRRLCRTTGHRLTVFRRKHSRGSQIRAGRSRQGRQSFSQSRRHRSRLHPTQRSMENCQAERFSRQEKCSARRLRACFHRWLNQTTPGGPVW